MSHIPARPAEVEEFFRFVETGNPIQAARFQSSAAMYIEDLEKRLGHEGVAMTPREMGLRRELNDAEQVLAAALPERFPKYPEDWQTEDRCVGEHTAVTLAMEVVRELEHLRSRENTRELRWPR